MAMRLAAMIGATLLAGCSGGQGEQAGGTATPDATQTAAAPAAGVTREEVTAPAAPVLAPAPAAIQTQPGPKGAQVSLNRVAVVGDIMTVALSYSGGQCCAYTPIADISAIDDATAQRMGVLKDNAGKWMAAPLFAPGNKDLRIPESDKAAAQVWFKFPAPPATTKTVSITIPEVAPFDAVPVTR